ncbi:hypothetical protein Taro_012656 [Colocasia esculenta]|uniref:Uncharacterized protein n=1 Tax=Colocasia esculenta TaxID=4460 RepID=A0A843UDL6_COLES|nr:hypothetical protein [Colocasia esculenta]
MAVIIRCSLHDPFLFPTIKAKHQTCSPASRPSLLPSSQMKPTRIRSTLLVQSTAVNKVFEDQALGIVCYKDEHGEVICEGYDEGPRHNTPQASPAVHSDSLRARKGLHISHGLQPTRRVGRRPEEGGPVVLCINGLTAEEPERL